MRLDLSTEPETDHADIVECESNCSFVTARTSLSAISEVTTTTTAPSKRSSPPCIIKTSPKNNTTKFHHFSETILMSRQQSFTTLQTTDSSTSTHDSTWDGDVSLLDDGDDIQIVTIVTPNDDNDVVTVSRKTKEQPSLIELVKQQRYDEALIRATKHPEEVVKSCSSAAVDLTILHLALDKRPLPPCNLVKEIIKACPAAVRMKESVWGFLPLHFACRSRRTINNKSSNDVNNDRNEENVSNAVSVIKELLRVYPDSIKETDSFRGMLPLHMAVDGGVSLAVVKLLIRKYPESVCFVDDFGDYPIDFARRRRGRCDEMLETLLSVAMGKIRQQSLDCLALIEENVNDDNDDVTLSDSQHTKTDSTSMSSNGHIQTYQTPNQREFSHVIRVLPQSAVLSHPKKLQNKFKRRRSSLSSFKMKLQSKICGFDGRKVLGGAY